jgi:hypothetical protein
MLPHAELIPSNMKARAGVRDFIRDTEMIRIGARAAA